jgi:hypothetical protein
MNNSSLFGQSLESLSWEITRIEFGAKAIVLPQSFVATLFVSWSASQWKNAVLSVKATVRTPSVTGFSLRTRLLLFVLLLGTRKPIPKNTGSSLKHSMVYVEVLDIGMTRSMLFLFLLV